MPRHDDDIIIVIGDLHLSAGRDSSTGEIDAYEHFVLDASFARLLDHLVTQAPKEHQRPRLLLLGDVFDFVRVASEPGSTLTGRLDTSDTATAAKLDRIAAGHPDVFSALARFVGAGLSIDVVPGNHDIELVRHSTQARLREILVRFGASPEAMHRVRFHQWIYFLPGLLYAEHGQQYHDVNAFEHPMRPFKSDNDDDVALPLGSLLDAYLLDLLRLATISPRDTRSPARALLTMFRRHPTLALRTIPLHARFLRAVLGSLVLHNAKSRLTRRQAYDRDLLRPLASELGLRVGTLKAIDGLSRRSATAPFLRLLHQGGLSALSALGVRPRRSEMKTIHSSPDYLVQSAAAIHALLVAEGKSVPFYIFGHTHRAEKRSLAHHDSAYYLNAGSWIVPNLSVSGVADGRLPLTYVEIDVGQAGNAPAARVMLWDDGSGRPAALA